MGAASRSGRANRDIPTRGSTGWRDLHTKNLDPPIIAKAIEIARALGARVQGDDGEIYLPDGKIEQDGEVQTDPKMDWRKW